jgi:hypothetical protein
MVADDSYDAAEDNELSFKEGDKITEIDKVDADWWQGKANGATGLFPGKLRTNIGKMKADIQPHTSSHQKIMPHKKEIE